MARKKLSITLKVIIGYLLLIAFGAAMFWFIYNKIVQINKPTINKISHKRMNLIGDVATRLYSAEGISRRIVQDKDTTAFKDYHQALDTISVLIDSIKTTYKMSENTAELDSVQKFLILKENNLTDLLSFRREKADDNYYDRVLNRLEKRDYLFGSTNYKEMAKGLKPYQQKVLIDYLKYAEKDNAQRLTNRTADSLINTMKKVLLTFAKQEHEYQKKMADKEEKLLINDQKISHRLMAIRSKIEQDEIEKSLSRVQSAQETLNQTSKIMIAFGVVSILTILVFVVLITRDTNRSKQYRQKLEEAKTYAEGLLKSREQIMATVTHDLRSPLNSISGFSDLIAKSELKNKQKRYLKQIKDSSDFTLRLVNDLLDFSRLESGKLLTEALPFVPEQIIDNAVNRGIPTNNPKKLTITTDLEGCLNKTYISDPFRLQQILINLIGNAYKFTNKGSIIISAHIKKEVKDTYLHIAVKDSGIGIDKKEQKLIFQEFSQVNSSQHKSHKGFGLGLAISQQLAHLLHGQIDLKSEKGKGSTFTLSIPVKPVNEEVIDEDKAIKSLKVEGAQNSKILLVDDDASLLNLTSEILSEHGFIYKTASDGQEALEKIKQEHFDLVLTDIQMPRLDGYELLEAVKNEAGLKNLPIIAISGEGKQSKIDYLEKGFADYLLKPYQANQLLQLIARLLNLKTSVIYQAEKEKSIAVESSLYKLDSLRQFSGDNDEALKGILQNFIKNTTENLETFSKAIVQKNEDKIKFLAHRMLAMMRQLEAKRVVKPLEVVEQGQYENFEALKVLLNSVKKESRLLIKALKTEL